MNNIERIQKAFNMAWALRIALRDIKEDMQFSPSELGKAIGSLAEAERNLKKTIEKMNVK